MRQPNLPAGGTCRCSATQFEILAPPLMTLACHCVDCQRMCASTFSLGAMIPADGFKIVKGTPVARPLPGSPRHHFFCPICMTLMFTKVEGAEARVNVRATLCRDSSWLTPFIEIMTKDKLPWAVTPAIHSYDAFPSPAEFKRLLAEFAGWVDLS
ncbi:GFA family protein [uncultured Roseobacter sp.]|uniref:GFA family protein n=1 Tax=uncultured Roseobacter sp. TaxID=114847 RepID=UPI00261CE7D3|nr:GFA family protein [uncultured Roseobacter sp.]